MYYNLDLFTIHSKNSTLTQIYQVTIELMYNNLKIFAFMVKD